MQDRVSQKITDELCILQSMLKVEKGLRDTLVKLGQPKGYKTAKMKWFEDQIDRLHRIQGSK